MPLLLNFILNRCDLILCSFGTTLSLKEGCTRLVHTFLALRGCQLQVIPQLVVFSLQFIYQCLVSLHSGLRLVCEYFPFMLHVLVPSLQVLHLFIKCHLWISTFVRSLLHNHGVVSMECVRLYDCARSLSEGATWRPVKRETGITICIA